MIEAFCMELNQSWNFNIYNLENHGEFDANRVSEWEVFDNIEDSKTEYESVMTSIRSVSTKPFVVAGTVVGEIEKDSSDSR